MVEIWQTDARGVYLHPRDPNFESRDPLFQGYGESPTAADGSFGFRTLLPGIYGSRPAHINFKVKRDGRTLLTSQLYFSNDPRFSNAPRTPPALTLPLSPRADGGFRADVEILLR